MVWLFLAGSIDIPPAGGQGGATTTTTGAVKKRKLVRRFTIGAFSSRPFNQSNLPVQKQSPKKKQPLPQIPARRSSGAQDRPHLGGKQDSSLVQRARKMLMKKPT